MSRSYKKAIINAGGTKGLKHVANQTVRVKKEIPNGRAYKKYYESWDIVDFNIDLRFRKPHHFWFWSDHIKKRMFRQKDKNQYNRLWK